MLNDVWTMLNKYMRIAGDILFLLTVFFDQFYLFTGETSMKICEKLCNIKTSFTFIFFVKNNNGIHTYLKYCMLILNIFLCNYWTHIFIFRFWFRRKLISWNFICSDVIDNNEKQQKSTMILFSTNRTVSKYQTNYSNWYKCKINNAQTSFIPLYK